MINSFIQINREDNIAVALKEGKAGSQVLIEGQTYTLLEDIPFAHKMALADIPAGAMIIRYGACMGRATEDIKEGEWVHTHNVETTLSGLLEYVYEPEPAVLMEGPKGAACFDGYERADGEVGTRNEIWIIPTVSCVNPTVRKLEQLAAERLQGCCDAVLALPHNAGCSQLGEDFEVTQRILASLVRHPNAGGVLLVSLGCENNDLEHFLPVLGKIDKRRIKTMVTQDVPGDELEEGMRLLEEIAAVTATDRRTPVSVKRLKLGFKCGGSDALSGITANPLCGHITERICSFGGTAILTEVPEMFGAEKGLMNRAKDKATFDKVVTLINDFKQYYIRYDQPIYENPSPGNKAGGITTLEEKSLGCIQKGGHAQVSDTLGYGQQSSQKGLNLMIGPGNDSVSITNLLASGAQLLLFTTGRGNPLGTAVPTIKVASNSRLFERKRKWLDFNAGTLIEGEEVGELTDRLWQLIIDTASGRVKAQNELHGYREIMIFKDGVLL